MFSLYIAPANYVTGYDIIEKIGESAVRKTKKTVILYDNSVAHIVEKIALSFEKSGIDYKKELFKGECSHNEIERVAAIIKSGEFDSVTGAGGGKIMDTVKAAGFVAGVKVITVPTNAATCASWSSHSAVYTDGGIAYEYFNEYKNPDLLFLDKKIAASAPVRHLIAGIADTIAKWIETEVSSRNLVKTTTESEIALFLAKKCYDDMEKYGAKAVATVKKGEYSEEVDRVIESIIITAGLVGGIGGEACRAVAAHAVNNGFTVIPERYNNCMHGESVAFGNIVQMVLDKKEKTEIERVALLYKEIGVPLTMAEFGFDNLSEDELDRVVNRSIYSKDTMYNLPYKVEFEMAKAAFIEAEKILKEVNRK